MDTEPLSLWVNLYGTVDAPYHIAEGFDDSQELPTYGIIDSRTDQMVYMSEDYRETRVVQQALNAYEGVVQRGGVH